MWETTEATTARESPPPFWAFGWPGGQALARYLIDHPTVVRGQPVIDVACGSGVVALAAALAGAGPVLAVDVDPLAAVATRLNAGRAGLDLQALCCDVRWVDAPAGTVVTAGDVFYDRDMSALMLEVLTQFRAGGATVLVGDPRRSYLPELQLRALASYQVPVDPDLEGMALKRTLVACLEG